MDIQLESKQPTDPPLAESSVAGRFATSPLLWWLLVGLQLVPVWFGSAFPSQDGPVHVYIAAMLVEQTPAQAAYFAPNPNLEPNVAIHYLLGWLLGWVGDPIVAERLFLSGYVLAFALGARALVRRVSGTATGAVLLLPFALGYFVHAGFYNFCVGSALYLWVLSWWLGAPVRPNGARLAALALALAVLALTHMFWFVFTLLSFGVLRTTYWFRGERPLGDYLRDGCSLVAISLPGLWLVWSFASRYQLTVGDEVARIGTTRLLFELATARPLYSLDEREFWVHVPFLVMLGLLAAAGFVRALTAQRLHSGLGWLALVAVSSYLLDPASTADVPTWQRLLLPVFLVGVPWLTQHPPGRLLVPAVAVTALVLVAAGGLRLYNYARLGPWLDGYDSAASGAASDAPPTERRTLLALHQWSRFTPVGDRILAWRADPFAHWSARAATRLGQVDLRCSLLSTARYGYFPWRYTEALDPYRRVGVAIENDAPAVDLDALRADRGSVDRLVLFDPTTLAPVPRTGSALERSLATSGLRRVPDTPAGLSVWQR